MIAIIATGIVIAILVLYSFRSKAKEKAIPKEVYGE
jgi:hypothetical protein